MDNEMWLPVKGYEGIYEVSSLGSIVSTAGRYFGCRIGSKGVTKQDRYIKVYLTKNRKSTWFKVHRLVADHFIPNPENKPEVNHIDGDRANNSVDNLEWCTRSENMQHAQDNNLMPDYSGFNNPACILTPENVQYIRSKYSYRKYSAARLGKELNVSKTSVMRVINNKAFINI
jgi:hypothetical protein